MTNEDFNIIYWSFLEEVINNPEKYLSKKGRVLYNIVENKGFIKNHKELRMNLNLSSHTTFKICKELEQEEVITRERIKEVGLNCKTITFNDKVVRKIL